MKMLIYYNMQKIIIKIQMEQEKENLMNKYNLWVKYKN